MAEQFTQFDYLLNAFEMASQSEDPAANGYAAKRQALYDYVRGLERFQENAVHAIPTTWLDPLLSGPNAALSRGPYNGDDIERLLHGLRERLGATLSVFRQEKETR